MATRQIEYTITTRPSLFGAALASLFGMVVAGVFVLFTIGVAILLLPFVAVALGIVWWRWRKALASFRARMSETRSDDRFGGPVIDADYEIVDRDRAR